MPTKTPVIVDSNAFQEAQQAVFKDAGGPGGVQDNLPLNPGPTLEEQAVAKQQRQANTSAFDTVGSMWRQDGIVDGLVANLAGKQMVADPNYNPFEKHEWEDISRGVSEELQPYLYEARSGAHARYLQTLLLDKQKDQQRLSDLGAWGTAGRFAFDAVMPDQILAGMVGGRVAQVLKWSQVARAAKAVTAATDATEAVTAQAAHAAATAKMIASEGSVQALAGGAAAGAATNASFEKLRQNYNFENDSTQVLTAGLMGAGLSVPFGLLHMRNQRNLAIAANRDAEAMEALRADHMGEQLTPRQTEIVQQADHANNVVRAIEAGHMTPEEGIAALEQVHAMGDQYAGPALHTEETVAPSEAPQATLGPTPDGFIDRGSVGSAQVENINAITDSRTPFSKARLDISAVLNRSENPLVRRLGFQLVKDPIQLDSQYAQGWTASEWKSHLVRQIKGDAMTEMAGAFHEAQQARGLSVYQRVAGGFDQEFHELVTRLVRGDESVLHANPDIAPQLKRAAKAARGAYDNMLAEATAAGVRGTDTLSPHDNYVNRLWNHRKIRDAERIHGKDAVQKVVAGAIKVPGLEGNLEKAKSFLSAVKKLEFSPALQDIGLHSQDMATLRKALAEHNSGLKDHDIDAIINTMFEAHPSTGDAGVSPRLKYRFNLDENYALKTHAGELRISDLLENDQRMLLDTYFNSMAGHTAMAKMGVTSKADWDTRMREVSDWFDNNATKGDAGKRDVRYLNDIYANVTGRPMSTHDFSTSARAAGAFRAYTRSIMLGQLGISAAFELKQAAALFTFRAMLQHSPTLSQLWASLKSGHVPNNKFARDVSHMTGFANEMAMSYARHSEVEDGFVGRALNGFENFGNKASHTVDILSGNAGFTALTRNWAARGYIQRAADWAHDVGSISDKWKQRLVGWGINQDDLEHVLGKLKEHTEFGPSKRVEGINYEDWLRDSPDSYNKFLLSVERAARDAIQDHDLGETMMFTHSTLGKVFAELKNFFLVAHAKNMLKNMHYRDPTALYVWSVGVLGEALGYAMQQSANYALQPDKLQKQLAPEKVAIAALMRMSSAGMVPFLADTLHSTVTGKSLTQPGSTVNTSNRSLFLTPSMIVGQRLINAPQALTGFLLGTHTPTQQEARDLAGILPGSRLMGPVQVINYLSDLQPKSDPHRVGLQDLAK